MKKRYKIIIIVLIILAIFIPVSIHWPYVKYVEYTYTIEIQDQTQNKFVIEVPIPINKDGQIKKILENIKILKGNCSFEINESSHGISLRILGANRVILQSKIKKEDDVSKDLDYLELSMTDYDNFTHVSDERISRNSWFFSNNSVKIDFYFKYRDGFHRGLVFKTFWGTFGKWSYSGELDEGWQVVQLIGFDAEA